MFEMRLFVMRILSILMLLSILGCEPTPSDGRLRHGSSFTLKNNTFGVNDFLIHDSGKFTISFGSIDWGRNIYRNHENQIHYGDSIGYIYFNGRGSGEIKFTNQDTLPHFIPFTYDWLDSDRNYQYLNLWFERVTLTTYSQTQPLLGFGYQKVGKNYQYKVNSDTYSGQWKWIGNKLLYNERTL